MSTSTFYAEVTYALIHGSPYHSTRFTSLLKLFSENENSQDWTYVHALESL
jgi:hypothetical protein